MFRFLLLFVAISLTVNSEGVDSTSMQSTDLDSLQNHSFDMESSLSFDKMTNQYVIEDMDTFDKDEIIESDIIALDEDGVEYVGVIYIQDFKAEGIIVDSEFNEINIRLDFLPTGELNIHSELEKSFKVEILNFRLLEVDVL